MIAANAMPPAATANPNAAQYSHHAIDDPTRTTIHANTHPPANGATRSAEASDDLRSELTGQTSTIRPDD